MKTDNKIKYKKKKNQVQLQRRHWRKKQQPGESPEAAGRWEMWGEGDRVAAGGETGREQVLNRDRAKHSEPGEAEAVGYG